jgi:hypothetical protein
MVIKPDITQLARYGYDPRSRKYRDRATGRFVSPKEVRRAVDVMIDTETVKARQLAQNLRDGKLSLVEWQIGMANQLKVLHVAMGLAANGGLQNTSAASLGYIASLIKTQYQYLRTFVQEMKTGKQLLDGTLVQRSVLYIQASRSTYEQVVQRAARNGGATQEKSVLGLADHCTGVNSCVEQAAKGWAAIGTLVPVGQRLCKANCRCRTEYK